MGCSSLRLTQFREGVLDFHAGGVPLQRFAEVTLGFREEACVFTNQAGVFEIRGIDGVALHRRLDRLHCLSRVGRDASGREREVVERLRVVRIVFDGHVEVLVGRADVAFLECFHALRQIDLGDLAEVSSGFAETGAELRVVLLASRRVGQDVDRFGERLELAFSIGFVAAAVTIGMILSNQLSKPFANLLLGCGTLHAKNVVIVDLHPDFFRCSKSLRDIERTTSLTPLSSFNIFKSRKVNRLIKGITTPIGHLGFRAKAMRTLYFDIQSRRIDRRRSTSSSTLRMPAICSASLSLMRGLRMTALQTSLLRSRTRIVRSVLPPLNASCTFWPTLMFRMRLNTDCFVGSLCSTSVSSMAGGGVPAASSTAAFASRSAMGSSSRKSAVSSSLSFSR